MTSKKHRILFTAGGSPVHEAIYRFLSDKYDLFFADMEVGRISPSIPEERKIVIPRASDPAFGRVIIDICRAQKIDLLVPGVDEELLRILDRSNELLPTKILLPNQNFVEQMLDKFTMIEGLSAIGVETPRSVIANQSVENFVFPVIVKPRKGRGSRDVFTVSSYEKLKHFLLALEGNLEDWIIQEKIYGTEYTVQVIATAGPEEAAILPIQVGEKRGSTIFAETVSDRNVEEYCQRINDILQPGGVYNVQLIKDRHGKVFSFEINPRISTTFCMVLAAGLDPFSAIFGSGVVSDSGFSVPHLKLARHWVNVISGS